MQHTWAWAKRHVTYDETTCARTLDIMRRSCRISVSPGWSPTLARILAKTLWTPGAPDGATYRLLERVKGS